MIVELKEGQVFKNYKELCEFLNQPIKSGKSKRIQLESWNKYFDYEKDGHKFIIVKVHDNDIQQQVDRRCNNINLSPMIEYLQLMEVETNEYFTVSQWLCNILRLINDDICNMVYRGGEELANFCTCNNIYNDRLIHKYISTAKSELKNMFTTALNHMQKDGLATYQLGYKVVYRYGPDKIGCIATDQINDRIVANETKICNEINEKYEISGSMKGRQLLLLIFGNSKYRKEFERRKIEMLMQDRETLNILNTELSQKFHDGACYIGPMHPITSYYESVNITYIRPLDDSETECAEKLYNLGLSICNIVRDKVKTTLKKYRYKDKIQYGKRYYPFNDSGSEIEMEIIADALFHYNDNHSDFDESYAGMPLEEIVEFQENAFPPKESAVSEASTVSEETTDSDYDINEMKENVVAEQHEPESQDEGVAEESFPPTLAKTPMTQGDLNPFNFHGSEAPPVSVKENELCEAHECEREEQDTEDETASEAQQSSEKCVRVASHSRGTNQWRRRRYMHGTSHWRKRRRKYVTEQVACENESAACENEQPVCADESACENEQPTCANEQSICADNESVCANEQPTYVEQPTSGEQPTCANEQQEQEVTEEPTDEYIFPPNFDEFFQIGGFLKWYNIRDLEAPPESVIIDKFHELYVRELHEQYEYECEENETVSRPQETSERVCADEQPVCADRSAYTDEQPACAEQPQEQEITEESKYVFPEDIGKYSGIQSVFNWYRFNRLEAPPRSVLQDKYFEARRQYEREHQNIENELVSEPHEQEITEESKYVFPEDIGKYFNVKCVLDWYKFKRLEAPPVSVIQEKMREDRERRKREEQNIKNETVSEPQETSRGVCTDEWDDDDDDDDDVGEMFQKIFDASKYKYNAYKPKFNHEDYI